MKTKIKLKIIEEDTIEEDFGWVYFYTIDSDDPDERIGGNAPLFIDKDLQIVFSTGTRKPVADYIFLYQKHRGDMEAFKKSYRS